jgi:hypothetical protein
VGNPAEETCCHPNQIRLKSKSLGNFVNSYNKNLSSCTERTGHVSTTAPKLKDFQGFSGFSTGYCCSADQFPKRRKRNLLSMRTNFPSTSRSG